MKFKISGFTKRSFSMVSVEHPGEAELVFSAGGYTNTKPGAVKADETSEYGHRVELFEEVNDFISKLKPAQQESIFDCYARLENLFGDFTLGTVKEKDMDNRLADIVSQIYDIVRFEDLRDYIVTNSSIRLPLELSDDYVTNDKITPLYIQRTYRKSEYIDLVAVALGLRFMIPIWGGYLPIVYKGEGPAWKEYYGFKLLDTSSLGKCAAFDRLETYIRANINEADYELQVVFKYLSAEEVPTYLMAVAIIRKLSVAPLSAESDKDHLMKIIYNYSCGNNTRMPAAFGGNIAAKTDPETVSDDNSSVWCAYKSKEQLSAGDLVLLQIYTGNYVNTAQDIEPNIPLERIEKCVKYTTGLDGYEPSNAQKTLAMWVMSTVIVGCAIDMFDRQTLITAVGIAQAVLWEWEFPQLAILLTASPIILERDEILSVGPKKKISDANLERLAVIYPYETQTPDKGSRTTSTNAGVQGVEDIAVDLIKNNWEPRCCKELAKVYNRVDVSKFLEVSTDIRDQIAELFIRLDRHVRH